MYGQNNEVLHQPQPIKMNGPQVNEEEAKLFEQQFNNTMYGQKNQVLHQQQPIKMNGPQVNEEEAKLFEQ
jgi:hypothetical protein